MSPTSRGLVPAFAAACLVLSACKEEKRVAQYTVPKEAPEAVAAPASPGMTAPGAGTPGMPGSGAMAPNAALIAQTSGFTAPEWTVPAAWNAQPANPMRKGGWTAGPETPPAEISVTAFPGDVGGLQANVGRWCQQVGLPAPASAEALAALVKPATVGGLPASRVTLVNAGKALTAVLVQRDGATWFFKLAGPAAPVAAASGDFDAFVASVKFPAAQ